MSANACPKDFLIRLTPRLLPASRATASKSNVSVLLPDGLEHSKFRNVGSRKGFYVVCRKDVVPELLSKGATRFLSANTCH